MSLKELKLFHPKYPEGQKRPPTGVLAAEAAGLIAVIPENPVKRIVAKAISFLRNFSPKFSAFTVDYSQASERTSRPQWFLLKNDSVLGKGSCSNEESRAVPLHRTLENIRAPDNSDYPMLVYHLVETCGNPG